MAHATSGARGVESAKPETTQRSYNCVPEARGEREVAWSKSFVSFTYIGFTYGSEGPEETLPIDGGVVEAHPRKGSCHPTACCTHGRVRIVQTLRVTHLEIRETAWRYLEINILWHSL